MSDFLTKFTIFMAQLVKKLWFYTLVFVGAVMLYYAIAFAIEHQKNSSAVTNINYNEYVIANDGVNDVIYLINKQTDQVAYKIGHELSEAIYVIKASNKAQKYAEATNATTKQTVKKPASVSPTVTK